MKVQDPRGFSPNSLIKLSRAYAIKENQDGHKVSVEQAESGKEPGQGRQVETQT